jgi:hypothetical protein
MKCFVPGLLMVLVSLIMVPKPLTSLTVEKIQNLGFSTKSIIPVIIFPKNDELFLVANCEQVTNFIDSTMLTRQHLIFCPIGNFRSQQPRRTFFSWIRNTKHDPRLVEPANKSIQGLRIIPKYFTISEHDAIVEEISALLQRENPQYQHFFQRRTLILEKEKLDQLPVSMRFMERIYKDGLIQEMADCVQVAEYGHWGGTSIHGDCQISGDSVGIIGLVSKAVVTFRPVPPEPEWRLCLHPELEELEKLKPPQNEEVRVLLEPRSLLMIAVRFLSRSSSFPSKQSRRELFDVFMLRLN